MTGLDVHLRRHGICWLVAVGLAALAAILVGLPSRAGARTEGRVAGTTTPTPSPTPQRTGDLGFVGIEGRVYDASRGPAAGIEGAVVEYFGSDPGTVLSDENGDFVFRLFLHDTGYVSIAAWAPGFAASELRSYRALDLYFGEQVEFGLEPGSGEMDITPHGVEDLPCEADTAVRIASSSPEGEPLTIVAIAASNSYSQGDYGSGFTVDLSGIDLPLTLPAGEHVDIPVHYSAAGQSAPSRLTVRVRSTARNSDGFAVPYRGGIAGCGAPTPTPTASPTPQRTGDLGIVEVRGRVYDASCAEQTGIAGATVRHGGSGAGSVETDASGNFAFSRSLHDTDAVRIEVSAVGFTSEERVYGAVELAYGGPLAFGLTPLSGLIEISPLQSQDLPCVGDGTVTIASVAEAQPLTITAITANNSYSQGHYGTGFTADLSHIDLPLTLPAGESISFPVHYDAAGQSFPSRLTIKVESSASAYPTFAFPYRGAIDGCGSACAGDCDGDRIVTIAELVRGVALALGRSVAPCSNADLDANGSVVVNELVAAVLAAGDGCP
jgi:hypothetical protein